SSLSRRRTRSSASPKCLTRCTPDTFLRAASSSCRTAWSPPSSAYELHCENMEGSGIGSTELHPIRSTRKNPVSPFDPGTIARKLSVGQASTTLLALLAFLVVLAADGAAVAGAASLAPL